ncbi:MAG TPA: hypothetical protein VM661_19170 [Candidatus Sulfotelmatobacter sp.]|jgi:hypothetical protein|nr:hypothetical protein [Candidatus Sulfotelmatobacter sp.]
MSSPFRSGLPRPAFAGLALLVAASLGACTEKPYVYSDYRMNQQGEVRVCFDPSSSTPEEVAALAEQTCNRYHRTAKLWVTQKSQCTWTTPDISTFYCAARPGETPPPLIDKKSPLRQSETTY